MHIMGISHASKTVFWCELAWMEPKHIKSIDGYFNIFVYLDSLIFLKNWVDLKWAV